MKAEELRIGNLVNVCYSDKRIKLTKVKSIHEKGINISATSFGDIYVRAIYNYEAPPMGTSYKAEAYILPIPLDEEWLLKFGMEYYDGFSNQRFIRLNKHEFDSSKLTYSHTENLLRFNNGEDKGTSLIPYVKYVHQLQNLYYALTGEELIINEI